MHAAYKIHLHGFLLGRRMMMAGLVSCEHYRCGTVGESNSTSYPLFLTADSLDLSASGQSTVDAYCILRAFSRKVYNRLENRFRISKPRERVRLARYICSV